MKATPKPSEVGTPQLAKAEHGTRNSESPKLVQVQFLADIGQYKTGDTALLPEAEAQILPSHAAHVVGRSPNPHSDFRTPH
jgi:hypothetical protein